LGEGGGGEARDESRGEGWEEESAIHGARIVGGVRAVSTGERGGENEIRERLPEGGKRVTLRRAGRSGPGETESILPCD
jgi:hypothetical protein